jgi:hypothetical protein
MDRCKHCHSLTAGESCCLLCWSRRYRELKERAMMFKAFKVKDDDIEVIE